WRTLAYVLLSVALGMAPQGRPYGRMRQTIVAPRPDAVHPWRLDMSIAAVLPPIFSPTNIFAPASTPADGIFELSLFVLAVTAGIFVTVGGLLVYAVVQFRRRPEVEGSEPPQVYGSYEVELAWTVIPVL